MTANDPLLAERLKLADAALKGLETVALAQVALAELPLDHPDRAGWTALLATGLRLADVVGHRLLRLALVPDVASRGGH